MLEREVEQYMRKKAKACGCLFEKFICPGDNGVPDRIILHPSFTAPVFIELKAPGKKPRRLQEECHKKLRAHGAEVYVTDTKDKVDEFFKLKNLKEIPKKKGR